MRTRLNRRQHLLRLRRREDENKVLRRLLHNLQQSVEALLRDHVRLVDNEDAVARLSGRINRPITQLTHIIDTTVAGRVELRDVEAAGAAGSQCQTRITGATRGGRRALHAVQRAGHNTCRRRLSAATRAGKEVGMVDSAGVESSRQRVSYMLLADNLVKGCGTIFSVKCHACRLPGGLDTRKSGRELGGIGWGRC